VLPANPRQATTQVTRAVEQALSLSDFTRAQAMVTSLVENNPGDEQAVQLFSEVHRALRAEEPVSDFIRRQAGLLRAFSAATLIRLAGAQPGTDPGKKTARELYAALVQTRRDGGRLKNVSLCSG